MKELTLRDYKILSALDRDPKISFNKIGRDLRLSPSVVERRVKNLFKNGVIKSFLSIQNYKRLGYTYYSVYARFRSIDERRREEMYEYLKEHPLSGQILKCDGRWQLVYGFFAKDIFQLNDELKKFDTLYGDFIGETEKIIHIGSHHFYRGYLINKELFREHEPFLGGPEKIIQLEKENLKLLNLLRNNPRANIIELAGKMHMSIDQIRYRIKKLEKEKILLGSWLQVNPKRLGLESYRVLLKLKNMNNESEKKLLFFLNIHKNVIRANYSFGSWDFFTDLEINPEGFRLFLDSFIKIFSNNIQEYETINIYEEIKYTFSPFY